MEEKTININEFKQAIDLLRNTLKNKIRIKDDDGKDVEFLISYTEGDSQVMILNGTPNMIIGNVMSMVKKLPPAMKLDFMYGISRVLKNFSDEFEVDTEVKVEETDNVIDLTKLTKTGKA